MEIRHLGAKLAQNILEYRQDARCYTRGLYVEFYDRYCYLAVLSRCLNALWHLCT
jgi:hypothetical protein